MGETVAVIVPTDEPGAGFAGRLKYAEVTTGGAPGKEFPLAASRGSETSASPKIAKMKANAVFFAWTETSSIKEEYIMRFSFLGIERFR
ncbi:hypothetical protein DSM21852_07580 [Methylocystis bryophila]|nr:hypothetical protein DSM21852_07580 [Methylocystis bryophila]